MDYETHRFAVLDWLARVGGRARIISGVLQVPPATGVNLKVSVLVSPRNKICPEFPLMPGIFNDSDFRVYENAEGEWLCPATHPNGYTAILAEAASRIGSTAAA